MNYTIVVKTVIREVIGIITIVLFIYTYTKIKSSAGHSRTINHDTVGASATVQSGWSEETAEQYPLMSRPILTPAIRLAE
jgi:hypothetical protein